MKLTLKWNPSKVGCYWFSGDFSIATRVLIQGGKTILTYPESGYVLTHKREEVGIYRTLKAAQGAAESIQPAQKEIF